MNERLRGVRFPPQHVSEATGSAKAGAGAGAAGAAVVVAGGGKGAARAALEDDGLLSSKRTAWSYEKLAEECYTLAEEHSVALQLPPLFFPKISDLVLWVGACIFVFSVLVVW